VVRRSGPFSGVFADESSEPFELKRAMAKSRDTGLEPTTAASSFDGCKGFIRAGLTFLPDAPLPALAVLADAPSAELVILAVLLLAALSIGLLFSKFEQVQRLKEVLIAEQNVLRQSEERFRALVQNSSDMIAIINPLPPTIKFMSDSIHRVLGHRPENLLGTDFTKLLHPDDGGKMQRFLANCAFNPRSTYLADVRLRHANGSWSQVEMFGDNRVDDAAIGGIVINFRDASERISNDAVVDTQQTNVEFPERRLH